MSAWPDERIAELRRLIDSGLTYREIAFALGTTKNAIIGKAHRLSIYSDRAPPKPYTARDVADLKAAIASGLDLRSISAAMDRTLESLKHKIDALGLAKPARGKVTSPAASRRAQSEGLRNKGPIPGRAGAAKAETSSQASAQFVTRPARPLRVRPVVDGCIPFIDRTSQQCAFILGASPRGAVRQTMCCGKDVRWRKDGTPASYCAEHYALVYRPSEAVSSPEKVAA